MLDIWFFDTKLRKKAENTKF